MAGVEIFPACLWSCQVRCSPADSTSEGKGKVGGVYVEGRKQKCGDHGAREEEGNEKEMEFGSGMR